LLSAVLGAMDAGSNDNVFIPAGVWLILTGVLALKQLVDEVSWAKRWNVHLAALAITWAVLAYDPRSLLVPAGAYAANRDLVAYVRSLDGPVYAPEIGMLPTDNPFFPTLHWVSLEDMIRGPNVDEDNRPLSRRLLRPVLDPKGPAYVLVDSPLSQDNLLRFLGQSYVLKVDLGDRFDTLAGLSRRFSTLGPRYLYQFRGRTRLSAP